ncbi:LIM/homeobox protein Awh [Folsomia candida]|uniref:LIM/homeobox protein Awh n=2 Tax=Folsomia candida TaxID=158441 RepID=A0A226EPX2_FOLCA|nr:LIM/homeobox protein Awh [Folsomia candida]
MHKPISFGTKCAKCTRWISSSDWVRRARDSSSLMEQVYHLACFACDACKRQLSTGEEFALIDSKVLCKTHYQETIEGPTDDSDDSANDDPNHTGSKSKTKRVRTTFTDEQLQILQANFLIDSNPDGQDLERIAQITGLSKRVTQVWIWKPKFSTSNQPETHIELWGRFMRIVITAMSGLIVTPRSVKIVATATIVTTTPPQPSTTASSLLSSGREERLKNRKNGSNNTLAERMAPAKARKAVEIFSEQFRMDELTRRRATGDEITVAELSKLASKKWRELSTEQKAKFNNMADKEREKYGDGDDDRKSRRSVKNKDKGEKENRDAETKKPKKVKDPNAPKRNMTSFFVFSNEQRPILKTENPEFKTTEVAKELGRRWKELDAAEKKRYETIAEEDKKRYVKELAAYEKSQRSEMD